MKKKGFTLVELLAVIAILAILVIIAMPNVLNMFNKAKQDSFETEVKTIIKTTEKQWISDSMGKPGVNETIYCRVDGVDCENSLKMDGNDKTDYYVKVDSQGNIVELGATNNEYQFSSNKKGLKADDEISSDVVSDLDKDDILKITSSGVVITSKNTIYNKKYLLRGGNGSYVIITSDNTLKLYNTDNSLNSQIPITIDQNIININNAGMYNGSYRVSSDTHKILFENFGEEYDGLWAMVEEGYCTHDVLNSNGGTWLDFKTSLDNKPEFYCYTCGEKIYENNYEIIDGVLYTYNITVGNGWELNDVEYIDMNSYSALIWDKTLEEIHVRSTINGKPVKYFTGYQRWTDNNDLKAKIIKIDMFTMSDWNSHDNYMKSYATHQNREYLLNLDKVICSDGTIQYDN